MSKKYLEDDFGVIGEYVRTSKGDGRIVEVTGYSDLGVWCEIELENGKIVEYPYSELIEI